MKVAGVTLALVLTTVSAAEQLPENLSREPNCIEGTYCLKKDGIYIDTVTLPDGFARSPNCSDDVKVICVDEFLRLEAKELVEIRKVAEEQMSGLPPANMKIRPVMDNIVLVSVHKQDYFGARLLLEKQPNKGWVLIRREDSIY